MGALHMNLNPGDSLISVIQCHLWEGMCKQAEYCLGVTCGVCSFSGRKLFQGPHSPGFVPTVAPAALSSGSLRHHVLCILTAISAMRKSRLRNIK